MSGSIVNKKEFSQELRVEIAVPLFESVHEKRVVSLSMRFHIQKSFGKNKSKEKGVVEKRGFILPFELWRRTGHHSSLPQVVSSHSKFEVWSIPSAS